MRERAKSGARTKERKKSFFCPRPTFRVLAHLSILDDLLGGKASLLADSPVGLKSKRFVLKILLAREN